ncbi:MAG TPA: hypothetical protein VIT01_15055 [Acidimicrobiales bacterium]
MKVRVTTAKGTYWVEEDEIDAIDDDTAADDEVPSGDQQDVDHPDPEAPGGMFAWLGDRFQTSPRVAEWVVGALVAMAAVAVTAYMARDMWFTSDEWEYLANRTAFDLGDLTRPVGGHWTTWSVLLLRGLYKTFGVDFWPWFYIPRLIGHTVLVTFIWRVMRRRGADPLVGIFAYAILLVLGASGYQRALQVGNWAVYAALIICALVISRRPAKPTTNDRVIVAVALMIAVLGNGYAVAVIGGIILTLLVARRLVAWIPSLIPAVLAYGIWWLNYRDDIKPKPELKPSKVLDIPWGAFRVVRTAVEAATGFPTWLAAIAVLGLLAWIVLLAVRRKFDLFDWIILATLAIGLCLLVVQRISIDDEAATRLRYGYSVSIMLAVALVPHIRLSKTLLVRGLFVLAGCGMIAANLAQMKDAINVREEVAQEARVLSVAAAEMVRAGEPVVAGPSTLAHGLETNELIHLVDDGYDPASLPEDQIDRDLIEADARGALRMNLIDRNRPRGGHLPEAGTPPTTAADVDAEGCVVVAQGDTVTATVADAGLITFDKTRPQSLALTWTDEFGEGRRFFDDPDIRQGAVELATPATDADLTLESPVGDLTVCGFSAP